MKYIIILLLLIGCDSEQHTRSICNCDQMRKVQAFIQAGIKPANNMSDEEMEDVIHELRNTAIATICDHGPVWSSGSGAIDWEKEKQDSCRNIQMYNY